MVTNLRLDHGLLWRIRFILVNLSNGLQFSTFPNLVERYRFSLVADGEVMSGEQCGPQKWLRPVVGDDLRSILLAEPI